MRQAGLICLLISAHDTHTPQSRDGGVLASTRVLPESSHQGLDSLLSRNSVPAAQGGAAARFHGRRARVQRGRSGAQPRRGGRAAQSPGSLPAAGPQEARVTAHRSGAAPHCTRSRGDLMRGEVLGPSMFPEGRAVTLSVHCLLSAVSIRRPGCYSQVPRRTRDGLICFEGDSPES